MKKIILTGGLCLILVFLNSCLTTLHPIFTEKDLVFDPRLAGSWRKTKDGSMLLIVLPLQVSCDPFAHTAAKRQQNLYVLRRNDEQGRMKSTQFAFMVKLGKYYYMDYYPARGQGK